MEVYWPIFRGKQFELLALRESAPKLSDSSIHPVIEPVKRKLGALQRCTETLADNSVPYSVVVNPLVGEYSTDHLAFIRDYEELLQEVESSSPLCGASHSFVLNLSANLRYPEAEELISYLAETREKLGSVQVHLLARGFSDPQAVKALLEEYSFPTGRGLCVLLEDGPARRHFQPVFPEAAFILIRDGFEKRKNADYEKFSTEIFDTAAWDFSEQKCHGFGDYSIVGKEFSESGGPAWAVAIHLTYVAENPVEAMYVNHYVSNDNDSPAFPAEKYLQALEKLSREATQSETEIPKTAAVEEFLRLRDNGHFPGLGYVKKLSMIHHLEVVVKVLEDNA
ncbi:sce7725 family protein [uncultured Lawsonella sp.]|uniref:sce7725 family protein n=1 Tax=uncultured Lawsonella sp. TaxID=1847727 RepID=UPI002615D772|nr:sce7725 family protein [uncultured Lawsonella sp.]